ncbi:response regulator [Methylobacterium sp. E-005]|uniref:response regulator n=1 Tax=Methylobacterium sp. E-005 TaxID=2836549 RepID=UPI001FBAE089|nr:response regulator [Methylobacterium sp. E-005]MCJ2086257.1 response regulator [Methylobacterium sp. E-005]
MSEAPPPEPPFALVVDDEPLILMEAVSILEEAGFQMLEAAHAVQALRVLGQHHARVKLLFSDVDMPGDMDGFALAREVARCWPLIAIVLASGRAKPGPGDLPEGATFISKPFSAQIVHHHVRKTMPEHVQPEPLRNK